MAFGDNRVVAVVGTGTVGASWAAFYLARGFDVRATDPAPGAAAHLDAAVDAAWPALERLGLDAGADRGRLEFSPDLAWALRGASVVQESAPEREDLKRALFGAIGESTSPDVLVASSSSGLVMSRLQETCRHPERFLVAHPFNPAHLMPLIEIVGGERTSDDAVEFARSFYASLGKRPVVLRREVVGHIANRLQAAVFREAVHLVASGVASAADVDAVMANGPGLRWAFMGPILTFHLGGGEGGMAHFLDHLGPAVDDWTSDLAAGPLSAAERRSAIAGAEEEAAGRSITELAADRDAFLCDLVALLAQRRDGG